MKKLYSIVITSILFSFFSLIISTEPIYAVDGSIPNRVGINIGDHFEEVDSAAGIVGPGGWIVVMAQPGDCKTLIPKFFKEYPSINFIIRGHYPNTQLTPGLAKTWANTLANMDTGGKKVYFYPVNEPWTEKVPIDEVKTYTATLVDELNKLGVRHTKVILLSPMVNKSYGGNANGIAKQHFMELGPSYFRQFDGVTLNLYDDEQSCTTPLCNPDPFLGAGNPEALLNEVGLSGMPIYGVESGVVGKDQNGQNDRYVMYRDHQLKPFFELAHNKWSRQVKMAAVFSYNPVVHNDPWNIYAHTQTAALFSNLAQQYGPNPPADKSYDEDNYRKNTLPPKLESKKYKKIECCITYVEPSGKTYCRSTNKANSCDGPLDAEHVYYRGSVIGINSDRPWQLKGKAVSPSEKAEFDGNGNQISGPGEGTTGSAKLSGQFVLKASGAYDHDRFDVFRSFDIGNIDPESDTFIDKQMDVYPLATPPFTRTAIPKIYRAAMYNSPKQYTAPDSETGEKWSETYERVFTGSSDELGTKATTETKRFVACLQAKNAPTGIKFYIDGKMEFITPPDIETLEIADADTTRSLVAPPCVNGFCHASYRFTKPDLVYNPSNIYNKQGRDYARLDDSIDYAMGNKTYHNNDIVNIQNITTPNRALATDQPEELNNCTENPLALGLFTTSEEPNATGTFDVSYQVSFKCTGCPIGDFSVTINGVDSGILTQGGYGFDTCQAAGNYYLKPGYGTSPGLPKLTPSTPVIVTAQITHGSAKSPRDGCPGPCPQNYPAIKCTIKSIKNPDGAGYVTDSNCKIAPPPPPPPVECDKCETWVDDKSLCNEIIAKELIQEPRCPKGKCISEVQKSNASCIWKAINGGESEKDYPEGGNVISKIMKCFSENTKFDFYVAPVGGFEADLNQYRTHDMDLNDAISHIPGINDEVFEPKPTKAKIYLELDQNPDILKDFTVIGYPVRYMYVQYTDHLLQARKFCERYKTLYLPEENGFKIPDDSFQELCQVADVNNTNNNGSGHTQPANDDDNTGDNGNNNGDGTPNLPPATNPHNRIGYPKTLAAMLGAQGPNAIYDYVLNSLEFFDVVILEPEFGGEVDDSQKARWEIYDGKDLVTYLQNLNPSQLQVAYMPMWFTFGNAERPDTFRNRQAYEVEKNGYYLKVNGTQVEWKYPVDLPVTNVAAISTLDNKTKYTDWFVNYVKTNMKNPNWDGIEGDYSSNVWWHFTPRTPNRTETNLTYAQKMTEMNYRVKQDHPNWIIMGNGSAEPSTKTSFTSNLHGVDTLIFEYDSEPHPNGFNVTSEDGYTPGSFGKMMTLIYVAQQKDPNISYLVYGDEKSNNVDFFRLLLSTSLMLNNGYMSFQPALHITTWKEEYSVDSEGNAVNTKNDIMGYRHWLGKPTSKAFMVDSNGNITNTTMSSFLKDKDWQSVDSHAWVRYFDYGMAIVNATNSTKTIKINDGYKRIKGTASRGNTGEDVNGEVTVGKYDGLLLVKKVD